MDNIDSMRNSSASSVIDTEQNLTALTSQAIASKPEPSILINKLNPSTSAATRDMSTTLLDAIKPNGPVHALNSVSTFAVPPKPAILVQRPLEEITRPLSNCTPSETKNFNGQKRRSAPVILPSNTKQFPSTANHKPTCSGFPTLSEELFNEQTRNLEMHLETLEELVTYQGPSVTDV